MDMRKGHMCKSAKLVTRTPCASKPQDPGPPPTCPFIKHHNVKEPTDKKPDTQRSPIFLPEEGVSCYVGDRGGGNVGVRRCGEGAYMDGV